MARLDLIYRVEQGDHSNFAAPYLLWIFGDVQAKDARAMRQGCFPAI
jgi:hypothetical protein